MHKMAEKQEGRVVFGKGCLQDCRFLSLGEQTACSEVESISWIEADPGKKPSPERITRISVELKVYLDCINNSEEKSLLRYTV